MSVMTIPELSALHAEFVEQRSLWRMGDRWRKPKVRDLFERWFNESCKAGRPPDSLERYESDEETRFFSRTAQGSDGHVYWLGGQKGFRRNDGVIVRAHRWWWEHLYGAPEERGVLQTTCGDKKCIHPHHLHFVLWKEYRRQHTDEQLCAVLQIAAMRVGHSPSREEYDRTGLRPVSRVFELRFGSWTKARDAARLAPHEFQTHYSKEECLAKVREVAVLQGRTPTQGFWEKGNHLPSVHTLKRRFGSWPEAMQAAGLEWRYYRGLEEPT